MEIFYTITIIVLAIATAIAFVWGYRKGVNDGRNMAQNKPLKMIEKASAKPPEQTVEQKKYEKMLRYIDEYQPKI